MIPTYIQYFVLIGIVALIVLVPIRILWGATRGSRERLEKVREVADRLREKFDEVVFDRSLFGNHRIRMKHEERRVWVVLPSARNVILRVRADISPKFHVYARTVSWGCGGWKFFWESFRFLRRFRLQDPLVDDRLAIYSTNAFGHYLRERALDDIPITGQPKGVAESFVILTKLPGVKKLKLTMSPAAGMRLHLKLRTKVLLERPEMFESAVHHLLQLYDAFVMY